MKVGRFLLRLVLGGLFVGHGTQKLFGWFGGPGPEGTEAMMDQLQMHPPKRNALAAGATETAGGALLSAGLATPVAPAGLIGVMTTAIRKVHMPNGVWNANQGYEYNLVIIAALLSLVDGGPGELSLDAAMGWHETGSGWTLAALATGAATSAATVAAGQSAAQRASTP
jgi:putative oxidoreductase